MDELDERREASSIDAQGIRPPAVYALEERDVGAGATVLALRGELDTAAAPALRARLDDCTGDALIVDLEDTTFIDSAVLRELLRARAELPARGIRLVLAGVRPPVLRLLELTGTAALFELTPDVDTALRQL